MTQVTVQKIVEGNAHVVVRVDMLADGSGELVDFPILSPADLDPQRKPNAPAFRLMQIWYGLIWFDVVIKSGGITPHTMWTLARDCDSHTDFRSFGGILDPGVYETPPHADTGILLLSTNGFTTAGAQGTLVFELRKTNG